MFVSSCSSCSHGFALSAVRLCSQANQPWEEVFFQRFGQYLELSEERVQGLMPLIHRDVDPSGFVETLGNLSR